MEVFVRLASLETDLETENCVQKVLERVSWEIHLEGPEEGRTGEKQELVRQAPAAEASHSYGKLWS